MRRPTRGRELPQLMVLSLSFLFGLVLGQAAARRISPSALLELREYLVEFLSLERTASSDTAFSTLLLYLRYPLLAFLGSAVPAGVLLLPLTGMAFAFFLSFSVCCFVCLFGGMGVVLALSLFGLRCLVTIPGFFFLASHRSGLTNKNRGREEFLRLGAVMAALLCGAALDWLISPRLLPLVLGRILNG